MLTRLQDLPIRAWLEHSREVFSVDWSNIKKDTFASSSWDGNVKLVSFNIFRHSAISICTPVDSRAATVHNDFECTYILCLPSSLLSAPA